MFKKILLTFLCLISSINLVSAQTWYPWRQRIYYNSTACTSLTDGKASDACYQHTTPALYVCDNAGSPCTTSAQWQLVTPWYLSGTNVLQVGNYNVGIGTISPRGALDVNGDVYIGNVGIGTFTSTNGLLFDSNNDGVADINLGSDGSVTIPDIHALSGTPYVCVNTTGKLVKSASACSGT